MPTPKGYRHKKLGASGACAKDSFRRVRSGSALVTVCCPKGQWAKHGRCKVSMRAVGLDNPKRKGFGEDFPAPRRFKIKLGR